jgi:hypothetical protein
VAGFTKVSDGNSPVPRDRIIFDTDYFNNAPLTAGGVNVYRFSPGFEKTFFNRRASVGVRVPFASTLSSDIHSDGTSNSSRAEFGDVHVTLKGLAYNSNVLRLAGGVGLAIPTADDTRVLGSDGSTLIRVSNDAFFLTPYVAYLLTPTDRLFFQNWYQTSFATNGNQVLTNLGSPRDIGRLNDQSLLQIDAQLGYWLYSSQRYDGLIRALAPFVELHYNSTMGRSDYVQSGALIVGYLNSHFDELNMSTGFLARIRNNLILGFGASFPLKGGQDRSFDYQLGLRGSLLFGPTARSQTAATAVSSF